MKKEGPLFGQDDPESTLKITSVIPCAVGSLAFFGIDGASVAIPLVGWAVYEDGGVIGLSGLAVPSYGRVTLCDQEEGHLGYWVPSAEVPHEVEHEFAKRAREAQQEKTEKDEW